MGEDNFVAYASSQLPNIYRVVNNNDVVPHAPPSYFGFRHGGHEEWYTPEGMQTRIELPSESDKGINSIPSFRFSAEDHHIANY